MATNKVTYWPKMDKRKTLTRDEALELVRRYKSIINHRFAVEPKVMMLCGQELWCDAHEIERYFK